MFKRNKMQSYINQLLEDITKAQREEISVQEMIAAFPKTFEEEMEEIERWVENEPVQTFSYFCGLEKEQFPPAEKLTKKQMKQIIKAFEQLLYTWNLAADMPENFPLEKKYTLLIGVLDEKTGIVNSGCIHFDFCTGDPTGCTFEEYCPCKKFQLNPHDDRRIDLPKDDLPF
jgi:hypothetical protein